VSWWETLLIILIAVGAKQVSEYMAIHPPYSCPAYCGVAHGHLFNGIDTAAVRRAKELPKKLKKILFQKIKNRRALQTPSIDVLLDSRRVHSLDVVLYDASRGRRQIRK
tara:strand:+ start:488 stop:814 length:327 start_codon:yes stop_codon:yes gene_type:complete